MKKIPIFLVLISITISAHTILKARISSGSGDYRTAESKTLSRNRESAILRSDLRSEGPGDFSDRHVFPEGPELLGNTPNPFNPSTLIHYRLTSPGQIIIEIFDLKGQRIKTLLKDHRESGTHVVKWNGDDDRGIEQKSGIYFYRISSAGSSMTKKMIMIK